MIGLDLDGTLLNTKKELTEYTKEILTRAIESGVTILTATGRPYTGIPEELREFPGDALRPDIQRREDHRPGENERHGGKGRAYRTSAPAGGCEKSIGNPQKI